MKYSGPLTHMEKESPLLGFFNTIQPLSQEQNVSSTVTISYAGCIKRFYYETRITMQALEDSELIAIPIATTEYLFDHFQESNAIARGLWEHKDRQAEERPCIVRIPNVRNKICTFYGNKSRTYQPHFAQIYCLSPGNNARNALTHTQPTKQESQQPSFREKIKVPSKNIRSLYFFELS